MTTSRIRVSTVRPLFVSVLLCAAVSVRAQHPALAPTANTTIVVPNGVMHYSSINIPAGVTVQFLAPGGAPGVPAIVHCDGDAVVHGTLSLTGVFNYPPVAGFVNIGMGPIAYWYGNTVSPPAQGGHHNYGSVMPFSLEGGSSGGWIFRYDSSGTQFLGLVQGGTGGGTLVLLAGGAIEVHGTVTADGETLVSGGSGGSILLRGNGGVHVMPGGIVTAQGGIGSPPPLGWPVGYTNGSNGNVRLDSWGAPPDIQGTVLPSPTSIELPYLRALSLQPTTGTNYTLEVFAPDTGWVYLGASLAPANFPTPFGLLGLDLAMSAPIAVTTPQPNPIHDPHITVQWPIPNSPALVGLAIWLQAIAAPQGLPPRLSNTIAAVVQ